MPGCQSARYLKLWPRKSPLRFEPSRKCENMMSFPAGSHDGISRRDALRRIGGIGLAGLFVGLGGSPSSVMAEHTRLADGGQYPFPRHPLADVPFAKLPVGSVEPEGWLRTQLERMAAGMAGHLHEIYPNVGESNAWRGGNGDVWERGPYWLDGAVPLAYILEDDRLMGAVEPYLEWTLRSQRSDGYFGPSPDKKYVDQKGFQTDRPGDWWPRMVMLKVLQMHHSATGDERVLGLMTNYFRYQKQTLPDRPLNHWSWWSKMRGGENQASVYWLYNRTGDESLLELAQMLFEQTHDWTGRFASQSGRWHGVNTGMGLKQPALQYLQTKNERYLEAVDAGLQYLDEAHAQPQGMFSGDELLHGTNPVHGTELCSIVETMYSLETLVGITGRVDYADRLERVAYNALPAQHSADYTQRQYYQQPNQIHLAPVERGQSPFVTDHDGENNCFGLLNGYPCCTTNMHQGWPKFVRSMWRATPDNGLAALAYGPCTVTARVGEGDGVEVTVEEDTQYPFEDTVRFTVETNEAVSFPLRLRIPTWVEEAAPIEVNGRAYTSAEGGQMTTIERRWTKGDTVTLTLTAAVTAERGPERAISVRRGPLVFARPVDGEREQIDEQHGVPTHAVRPTAPWNYGIEVKPEDIESVASLEQAQVDEYPWTDETAPVRLTLPGRQIPFWEEYNHAAGPLPPSSVPVDTESEDITLVPYGSTTLRVSVFPVVRA